MNKTDLAYRECVGIMLMNKEKKIFVAQRIDKLSDAWQMPQGGIDAGETPEIAAKRELKEETGTDKARILATSKGWLSYDLPDNLIPQFWGGKYRGQRQKWFLMEFTGEDSDINIHTETPEFLEWKWVDHRQLPELIVPFKKQLYIDVIREFDTYVS